MESVNPATGEVVDTYEDHTWEDVDERLEDAAAVSPEWAGLTIDERQQLLEQVAAVLRENQSEHAELITREMGKPITESEFEVEKCAWACSYFAERADEHLQDRVVGSEPDARTFVSYEPLGVVLSIMPWNFPFWQVFRFAAPALAAGNTVVLKHASNVPGCALAIEDIVAEAGIPDEALSTLLIGSDQVDEVIEDDRIAAVTLTGSEGAGRSVGETAGANIKPHVLELGGSDPFVVLEDASLDEAVQTGVQARTINSGQSCIAAKRFVVHADVHDEFLEAFIEKMESLTVGDPSDEDTDVGPQAREDLLEGVHEQVEGTLEAGATLECGGEPLDREGTFYPPTVLTDVPRDSPAATEEVFGPAAAVFQVDDESEAIEVANDIRFGLGASIWTDDLDRGERLAREVEAGVVAVNELVKSDPRLPFGGVKASGYGRELGRHGIHEFVNKKTVWVEAPDPPDEVATE